MATLLTQSPLASRSVDVPAEQEVFTRSLRFPGWLSTALLGIDAHELHHMYPRVPGYRLRQIRYATQNEMPVSRSANPRPMM